MTAARLIISDVVEIAAPAVRVWSVLADFARYELWNPLCRRIEVDGGIGGCVRMYIEDPRSESLARFDYTLVEFDPPVRLAWEAEFPDLALVARRDQMVQDMDDARSIYFTTDLYSGSGAAAAYEQNHRWVREGFNAMARALKAAVEGGEL